MPLGIASLTRAILGGCWLARGQRGGFGVSHVADRQVASLPEDSRLFAGGRRSESWI
jgi:hypothetical protein